MRFFTAFSSVAAICLLVACGEGPWEEGEIEAEAQALSIENLDEFEVVEEGSLTWGSLTETENEYDDTVYAPNDGVEKTCMRVAYGTTEDQAEANAQALASDCCGGEASAGVVRLVTQCVGRSCRTVVEAECIRHDS